MSQEEKECFCGDEYEGHTHPIEPQKENDWEEELNKKLTEWIDAGEIDEGIWIQNEIKDLINQILTQAIKEERNRIAKGIKELKKPNDSSVNATFNIGIDSVLSLISKENE